MAKSKTKILQKKLRREIVYEEIRSKIIGGEFPAGSPLNEVQLAESLQASRTPVREALMQLREAGLVEMVPRRGPIVRQLAPREITELFMAREALEVLALELCTQRMPEGQLKLLKAEWIEIQRNLSEETRDAVFCKCEEFHQQLIDAAQSPVLSKLIGTIRDRIASVRHHYLLPDHGRAPLSLLKTSCKDHLNIIDTIIAKDLPRGDALIRSHLRGIVNEILHGKVAASEKP